MKQLFVIAALIFLQSPVISQRVSINDFKNIEGSWSGQLTYLDYTSNKQESINANMKGHTKGNNQFELDFRYPGETGKGGSDVYSLQKNGRAINGMKVLERTESSDGSLKIVLEDKGKDGNDNKKATFNFILEMGNNKFVMTKMVKFDGEKEFFQRNQYILSR